MAIIPDPTDPSTHKSNEKPIVQQSSHFEPLQYTSCAPQINIPVPSDDAFALFQLFFSDKQLKIIIKNTNKNARIEEVKLNHLAHGEGKDCLGYFARPTQWFNTIVSKLYAYLAIHVYMRVIKKSNITDYWKHDWTKNHTKIHDVMSLNRFEDICQFLHVFDPSVQGSAHTKV